MEFHLILVTDVFGFVDVQILGSKVKVPGNSRQWPEKPGEYNILVTTGAIFSFTKIRSHMYLGPETYWLGFWVKRSKVKVTSDDDTENRVNVISL